MKFRPVSVPLVSVDPFFSIWSCHDNLYGGETQHWSGKVMCVPGLFASRR